MFPVGSTSEAGPAMTDVTIIGGGIVGLATAHALLERGACTVRILEKEGALAQHQSTHNSGVLHAGLQYRPGSEKARLARVGIRSMTEFCQRHDIAHDVCGKLVVATESVELPRLEAMLERGGANGLKGLRRLSPEQALEIEPHARCVGAILVPEEGITDYAAVCASLQQEVEAAGGEIVLGAGVKKLVRESGGWRVVSSVGDFTSRVIVNCAGLHSDRVTAMAGDRPPCRILPFRGEYLRLRPEREHLVRNLIYPLPEPGFPFLGVHFTRRIGGGIDAGPNAVLAFAREGYTLTSLNLRDLSEALAFPGLWRFTLRNRQMVA
jgi:L-2-hydroxyglutarate oxidase